MGGNGRGCCEKLGVSIKAAEGLYILIGQSEQ